ncbi:hypothetical protein Tco_0651248 [Tanacetum coccineum]
MDRITWLSISGLPPNVWTPEAFHTIASIWGNVIIPEECNSRQFNRTTGRGVCIPTTHLELIHTTSYVPTRKNLIPIRNESNDEDDDDNESEDGDDKKDSCMAGDNVKEKSTSLLVDGVKDNTKNIPSDKLGCRCGAQCVSDNDDSVDTSSQSNEVDNTLDVGNKIGFNMVGKEQNVASILENGDHMVDQ